MKENNEKKFDIKEFVKENKWKIAGGAALVVGGIIFAKKHRDNKVNNLVDGMLSEFNTDNMKGYNLFSMKWPNNDDTPTYKELIDDFKFGKFNKAKDLDFPKTDLGVITDLWDEGKGPLFAAEDININDAGKFITDLADYLADLDPKYKGNDMVSIAVAGFHAKEA